LVPFNIRSKSNSSGNNWSRYVELNVYGTSYRFLTENQISIDGVETALPFEDHIKGIKVYYSGKEIQMNTNFGLKIRWQKRIVLIDLCKLYVNLICGLCGRGVEFDKNIKPSPYQFDRNNSLIIGSNKTITDEKWAAAWRVPDDSPDAPEQ